MKHMGVSWHPLPDEDSDEDPDEEEDGDRPSARDEHVRGAAKLPKAPTAHKSAPNAALGKRRRAAPTKGTPPTESVPPPLPPAPRLQSSPRLHL